uniref:hypothetical protein n=1 Tax=Salmonella sp. s54836 TaxID=3159673 RepID=UPI0039800673
QETQDNVALQEPQELLGSEEPLDPRDRKVLKEEKEVAVYQQMKEHQDQKDKRVVKENLVHWDLQVTKDLLDLLGNKVNKDQ